MMSPVQLLIVNMKQTQVRMTTCIHVVGYAHVHVHVYNVCVHVQCACEFRLW